MATSPLFSNRVFSAFKTETVIAFIIAIFLCSTACSERSIEIDARDGGASDSFSVVLDRSQDAQSGYLYFSSIKALAQVFTPGIRGQLDHIVLRFQMLNGGESFAIHVAIVDVEQGMPNSHPLGEAVVEALVPGIGAYEIDFSTASIGLVDQRPVALVLSSDAPDNTTQTVAFGPRLDSGVGELLSSTVPSPWHPATDGSLILRPDDVITLQTFVRRQN